MNNNPEQELKYPCNDCNICLNHPDAYKYCEAIIKYSKQRHDLQQLKEEQRKEALQYVLSFAVCANPNFTCDDCPANSDCSNCGVENEGLTEAIKLLLKENF